MHNSIGYHTRLSENSTVKVCGGSFGGSFDLETVNRLVKVHFTVRALPSGTLRFVDRAGKDVSLYVSVDPGSTEAGKAARQAWLTSREALEQAAEAKRAELEDALSSMTVDEALARLRG